MFVKFFVLKIFVSVVLAVDFVVVVVGLSRQPNYKLKATNNNTNNTYFYKSVHFYSFPWPLQEVRMYIIILVLNSLF